MEEMLQLMMARCRDVAEAVAEAIVAWSNGHGEDLADDHRDNGGVEEGRNDGNKTNS